MRLASIAMIVLAGCGSRATEPAPPRSQVAPSSITVVEPDDEPIEPAVDPAPRPPSFSDSELDAMDEAALESACFAGSTAACDRLGH